MAEQPGQNPETQGPREGESIDDYLKRRTRELQEERQGRPAEKKSEAVSDTVDGNIAGGDTVDGKIPQESPEERKRIEKERILSAKTHYKVLGVSKDISEEDLKKPFRQLAKYFHTDQDQETRDVFEKVKAAYDVLSKKEDRKAYDNSLVLQLRMKQRELKRVDDRIQSFPEADVPDDLKKQREELDILVNELKELLPEEAQKRRKKAPATTPEKPTSSVQPEVAPVAAPEPTSPPAPEGAPEPAPQVAPTPDQRAVQQERENLDKAFGEPVDVAPPPVEQVIYVGATPVESVQTPEEEIIVAYPAPPKDAVKFLMESRGRYKIINEKDARETLRGKIEKKYEDRDVKDGEEIEQKCLSALSGAEKRQFLVKDELGKPRVDMDKFRAHLKGMREKLGISEDVFNYLIKKGYRVDRMQERPWWKLAKFWEKENYRKGVEIPHEIEGEIEWKDEFYTNKKFEDLVRSAKDSLLELDKVRQRRIEKYVDDQVVLGKNIYEKEFKRYQITSVATEKGGDSEKEDNLEAIKETKKTIAEFFKVNKPTKENLKMLKAILEDKEKSPLYKIADVKVRKEVGKLTSAKVREFISEAARLALGEKGIDFPKEFYDELISLGYEPQELVLRKTGPVSEIMEIPKKKGGRYFKITKEELSSASARNDVLEKLGKKPGKKAKVTEAKRGADSALGKESKSKRAFGFASGRKK